MVDGGELGVDSRDEGLVGKSEFFIKYEADVSSRVGGGERGVVDFGKLFTETSEQQFSLGGVQG